MGTARGRSLGGGEAGTLCLSARAISSAGASVGFSNAGTVSALLGGWLAKEEKYSEPEWLRMLRKRHHRKLVVKPPRSTTTSAGRPCHRTAVPWRTLSALMGSAAARP